MMFIIPGEFIQIIQKDNRWSSIGCLIKLIGKVIHVLVAEGMLDAHQIATDNTAFVPLYQSVRTQLRNPRIKDLTLRAVGNEFDFRTAYIEE